MTENHDEDFDEVDPVDPVDIEGQVADEEFIETPHGQYVARESADGRGWVAWTADYARIVGHWHAPATLTDVKIDLNRGVSRFGSEIGDL